MDMKQIDRAIAERGTWSGQLTIHEVEKLQEAGYQVHVLRARMGRNTGERRSCVVSKRA